MKKIIDLKAGDTFYYLPGRAVSEEGDTVTIHTVSKINIDNGIMSLYCDSFNRGKYPLFKYPVEELNTDSFFDKYVWFSTHEDGIKNMHNEIIQREIKYYTERIETVKNECLTEIEKLKKQLI